MVALDGAAHAQKSPVGVLATKHRQIVLDLVRAVRNGASAESDCHGIAASRKASAALSRERNDPRPRERLRQPRQHREVGVKLDTSQSANAERSQPVLMLQSTELALDSAASPIEVAPPLALARDQRVQARRLAPDRARLARPLGSATSPRSA